MRINKYLASYSNTSRRKAEELIIQGQVKINGKRITNLATQVKTDDVVSVNGSILYPDQYDHQYIVLNKPRGCITSAFDPEGRSTVYDYVPKLRERLFSVGRLDYDSEGLLLLTNDGDLCQKITHPSHEVRKIYQVKVFGKVNQAILRKMEQGIIDGKDHLKPLKVKYLSELLNKTWLEIHLLEGKNREIRRICEYFGFEIDRLKRVSINNLSLENLKPGDFYFIDKKKLNNLLGFENTKK